MRLSDRERRALARAMRDIDYPAEIFGSRLDDTARDGDINLIVFASGLATDERVFLGVIRREPLYPGRLVGV